MWEKKTFFVGNAFHSKKISKTGGFTRLHFISWSEYNKVSEVFSNLKRPQAFSVQTNTIKHIKISNTMSQMCTEPLTYRQPSDSWGPSGGGPLS